MSAVVIPFNELRRQRDASAGRAGAADDRGALPCLDLKVASDLIAFLEARKRAAMQHPGAA